MSNQKLSIIGAVLMVIGLSGYVATGQLADYKDERHESYMTVCKAAGHTGAECVFVKHYRQRAAALRGNGS